MEVVGLTTMSSRTHHEPPLGDLDPQLKLSLHCRPFILTWRTIRPALLTELRLVIEQV